MSSRLFDEIRERRGLAYSVYSATSNYADTGMWSVYAGTLPEHVDTVRTLIFDEFDRLVADGITDDELAVAVGYLVGAYEMGLEDTGARMSRLGGMLVTRGEVIPVDEQLRRWERVGPADIRRLLDRVFATAEPIMVSVGPRLTALARIGRTMALASDDLSEAESKSLLARLRRADRRGVSRRRPGRAVAMAAALGHPVAVKLNGESIAHKTERGLVRLGLADAGASAGRPPISSPRRPCRWRGVAARHADGRRHPRADGRADAGSPSSARP